MGFNIFTPQSARSGIISNTDPQVWCQIYGTSVHGLMEDCVFKSFSVNAVHFNFSALSFFAISFLIQIVYEGCIYAISLGIKGLLRRRI